MTADVELLPLYAELQGHPKLEIIKHYARANVLHHTEALRAEVAEARDGWHMANGTADLAMKHRDAAEARAERLAEALREVLDNALRYRLDECDHCVTEARAALNPTAAQENDDA